MDEKEKNVEVAVAVIIPDLASYMQAVIEQLEADKKRSAVHTYTYALKSVTEFYGGEGTPMPVDEVFTPGRLKEDEAGRGEKEKHRKGRDGKEKRRGERIEFEYYLDLHAEPESGVQPACR